MKSFEKLGLGPEIIASLNELGFKEPTPIQAVAIPFILKSKKDLIALAQTGTGKTAAFGLPILTRIKPGGKDVQAIILCPTRELCIQICQDLEKFARHLGRISITSVYGGEKIDRQIRTLRGRVDIVVGTPGRVCDLIRRKVLRLQSIDWLVLDEADEMLDMGFKKDLDAILSQIPETRRTLLFSATMSPKVGSIARKYMNEAEELSIGEKNVGADNVTHEYYIVRREDRYEALRRILDSLPGIYGILFCRTKNEAQKVADKLKGDHYNAEALHGDISQNVRTKIMDRFKHQHAGLLVATDVAARGIDVASLSHTINYSLPEQGKNYTHRSGRTGRAQQSGISISLVGPREVGTIREFEKAVGKKFEQKKIPSGTEAYMRQVDNFISKVKKADIRGMGHESYFSEIAEKMGKISKEDLIRHFVANEFGSLENEGPAVRDLNTESRGFEERNNDREGVSLKINLGKRHGLGIKEFFALVNSGQGTKGIDIGKIDLMPEYSVFSVGEDYAEKAIKSLAGANFRGRKVTIERVGQGASYPRGRGGRPGKPFGGKKRQFRRGR